MLDVFEECVPKVFEFQLIHMEIAILVVYEDTLFISLSLHTHTHTHTHTHQLIFKMIGDAGKQESVVS